jgi:hypothetical protein
MIMRTNGSGMTMLVRMATRAGTTTSTATSTATGSQQRSMSANAKVWIDKDTRVICQGFTGKQVRPCRQSMQTQRTLESSWVLVDEIVRRLIVDYITFSTVFFSSTKSNPNN